MTVEDSKNSKLHLLEEKNKLSLQGGGEKRTKKHKALGRLTARERLDVLLDPETFVELDRFVTHRCENFGMKGTQILGDGVITGYGKINGKTVYVYSQDFTVFGGSMSRTQANKIIKIQTSPLKMVAQSLDSTTQEEARIQEGVESLGGYADIFLKNTLASGVIPQISAVMGPCAGGAVYSPSLTDFISW